MPGLVVSSIDPATQLATVDVQGVLRAVNMSLVVDAQGGGLNIGDWVLIHVGFAMGIIDEEDARRTLELLTLLGGDNEDFAEQTP